MTDPSPETLFARFRDHGDLRALGAVFDALAPELLVVAAHLAPKGHEPEDSVQATFLAAMRDKQRWDATRRLAPWLLGILSHELGDARRRARRASGAPVPETAGPDDPARAAEAREFGAAFERALAGLPTHYKQVLTLRLVHGLSPAEIAHALVCPLATVKTRLARGRESLRNALPAGFAAGAAALLAPSRALASVREAVLAAAGAPAPALALASIGGALLVKKYVLALAVAGCVFGLGWLGWTTLGSWSTASADPAVAGSAAGPVGKAPSSRLEADSRPARSASTEKLSRAPIAAPGVARLRFVWKDEGTPVARLRVWVDDGQGVPHVTRDDGTLELQELAAGEHELDDHCGCSRKIRIEPGPNPEEIVDWTGGHVLTGRVLGLRDRPVEDAAIWATGERTAWSMSGAAKVATSGPDGAFRARVTRVDAIWARKAGWRSSRAVCPETAKSPPPALVLRLLAEATTVRGGVVAPNGVPVAGALVAIGIDEKPHDARQQRDRDGQLYPHEDGAIVLESDAQGRFASDEVEPGVHTTWARAPGFGAGSASFEARAGEPAAVRVVLQAGATVRGRVEDESGTPLADCSVQIFTPAQLPGFTALRDELFGTTTRSGRDGTFLFENATPGELVISASGARRPQVREPLVLRDGEVIEKKIVLPAMLAIRGRVLGKDGRAVPVLWQVWAEHEDTSTAPGKTTYVTGDDAYASPDDGSFVLENLADREYLVRVFRADAEGAARSITWAAPVRVRPSTTPLVLRVTPDDATPAYLTGRVAVEGGAPCAKFNVSLQAEGTGPGMTPQICEPADGTFRVGPLPAGNYLVSVFADLRTSKRLGVRTLAPGQTLDVGTIRFDDQVRVHLRLRHRDGTPVVDPDITFLRGLWPGFAGTEADGFLRTKPMNPGRYELRVHGKDFAPLAREVDVPQGQDLRLDLTVDAAPPVRIVFVPQDARDRWVDTLTVTCSSADGKEIEKRELPVDARGAFPWTRALGLGSFRIEASGATTGLRGEATVAVPDGQPGPVDVRVPMR